MKRIVILGLLGVLSACSAEENSGGRSDDAGGKGGGGGAIDAGAGGAGGSDAGSGGAAVDGGACQPDAPGPDVSDVSLRARDFVTYAGAVTVEAGDAGSLTLVPTQDAGRAGVTFDGAVPPLSPGAALWANFRHVDPMRTNPFAPRRVWHHVVRASETGPILAEELKDFMDQASSLTFLGAPIAVEKLCSADPPPPADDGGLHHSSGCIGVSAYAVTVRGDSDLELKDHTSGHISVDGIDYTVWANDAWEDYFVLDHPEWCIPDEDLSTGLALVARATRYEDVLPAADSGP